MSVPIVARLRTEWRRWKGQASGKAPRPRASNRKLQVEGLEGRALLSSITEYTVPGFQNISSLPNQTAEGPDGNLWFTDAVLARIGVMTTSGKVTFYPINATAYAITNGPDGALWFTQGQEIGRITTSGQITEFPVPDTAEGDQSGGIVTGPDGALWYTGNAAICRMTTTGKVTQYPLPDPSLAGPDQITVGPDGALWYTDSFQGLIGRVTTSGQVTIYNPKLSGKPHGIVTGPDGNLWVTEANDQHIARITTSGVGTEFSIQPSGAPVGSWSQGIIAGTDGNLYFSDGWLGGYGFGSNEVGAIGQITTAGVVQHFKTNVSGTSPLFLAIGSDGNIWFTDASANAIGVLSGVLTPAPTPTPTPTPSPTPTPTHNPTPTPTPTGTSAPSPTSTSTPTSTRPTTPEPAAAPRPAPKLQSTSPSSKPLSTRTFLSIKPRSTALGQPVILTARVADLSRPQFNPTGTVAFMAGGTRLGTAELQGGMATLTTAALPAGRDRVRVVYLGTTDFRQSRSAILIERVGARRPDAPPGDHSRNIAGTTSHVHLLRRQAVVNAGSGAEIIASSEGSGDTIPDSRGGKQVRG